MHIYDLFRWVLAVSLGLFGCWIIILNFVIVYRWYARREHHSFVPLVGGFLAFFAMGACPLPQVQRFAWIPLLIDAGYVLAVLTFGVAGLVLRKSSRGKRSDG